MWAQLIKVRLQPGVDMTAMADMLKRFEQPDSGQAADQELMAKALAGPPGFTDLTVVAEWAP